MDERVNWNGLEKDEGLLWTAFPRQFELIPDLPWMVLQP